MTNEQATVKELDQQIGNQLCGESRRSDSEIPGVPTGMLFNNVASIAPVSGATPYNSRRSLRDSNAIGAENESDRYFSRARAIELMRRWNL